jgi:hypothetical protein
MIIKAWILCLFLGGTLIEHTYRSSMSECLSAKRKIERNLLSSNNNAQYKCGFKDVKVEPLPSGGYRIISVVK